MSPTKDNRIASTDATHAPMDPERLAALRKRIEPCVAGTETHFPILGWGEVAPLLADRDRLAAEVKTLARALLAWMRLGDRGFGDPADWDCYEYRGWKLDMGGYEEFFTTEFEAQAIKTACVNAHGLADIVLRAGDSSSPKSPAPSSGSADIFGRVEMRLDPSGYDPKRDGGGAGS